MTTGNQTEKYSLLQLMATAPLAPSEFHYKPFELWLKDSQSIFNTHKIVFSKFDILQIHAKVLEAEKVLSDVNLNVVDLHNLFGKDIKDQYDGNLTESKFDLAYASTKHINPELSHQLLKIYHELGEEHLKTLKLKYYNDCEFESIKPTLMNAYLADKQSSWAKVYANSLTAFFEVN